MRRTLVLLAAAAALFDPALAEQPAPPTIDDLVKEVRAELFKPGPILPGWNVGGADPVAELDAAGSSKYVLLTEDADGERSLQIRTAARIDSLAPAGWRVVDSVGSPIAYAANPSIGVTRFGTGCVVGTRFSGERKDRMDCGVVQSHAIV